MFFIYNNNKCVLLALLLIINLVQSDCNNFNLKDNLKFEIFKKGFRVLLVDKPGVEEFEFHGEVNKSISCVGIGQFAQERAVKCGNNWVFEDKEVELKIGDKVSYWVFVIRHKLGFRIDDQSFIVNEISDWKPLNCHQYPWINDDYATTQHTTNEIRRSKKGEILPKVEKSVCCQLYLNVSYRIVELAEENIKLQNENKILAELLQRDDYNARTLKIFGQYSSKIYMTPKSFVQSLIIDKLGLKDVEVVEANIIPLDGVSFKVKNSKDKVKVILAAQKGLEGSNYELTW